MTQEAFGALGGVKRETQYLYEKGIRIPSIGYLLNIVAGGANLEFLAFGDRGQNQRKNVCINREVHLSVYKLVEEFAKDQKGKPLLNIEQRAAIFEAICDAVAGMSQDEVDWNAIRAWPKALAKSRR